jgi:hypothetical protein
LFHSYLAAASRSGRRDRFYALLYVFGLGLGFAAAIGAPSRPQQGATSVTCNTLICFLSTELERRLELN